VRGSDDRTGELFSYVDLEARVRTDHPLRVIKSIVNEALSSLEREFASLYSPIGRPSIPPEKLLRAMLLQAFYSIRSERQLMERRSAARPDAKRAQLRGGFGRTRAASGRTLVEREREPVLELEAQQCLDGRQRYRQINPRRPCGYQAECGGTHREVAPSAVDPCGIENRERAARICGSCVRRAPSTWSTTRSSAAHHAARVSPQLASDPCGSRSSAIAFSPAAAAAARLAASVLVPVPALEFTRTRIRIVMARLLDRRSHDSGKALRNRKPIAWQCCSGVVLWSARNSRQA